MVQKLTTAELQKHLKNLPNWVYDAKEDSLKRNLQFANFADALGFMVTVGVHAQARDHHPEWFNVYNRVDVAWRTHDCNGVSILDVEMAQKCDEIFQKYKVTSK